MTTLIIVALLSSATPDTLTLEQSYHEATENHPLRLQIAVQRSIADLQIDNLGVAYLPSLTLRGQAVYHSDVAEIAIPGASTSISQPPQDQYKIALGVDQLIYDGGVTSDLKSLERLRSDLESGKVEVELHKVREQVNSAYFGVLLFDAQLENIALIEADLSAKLRRVESLVDNGAALQTDADVLAAELISVEQQRVEAQANRQATVRILAELLGRPLDPETVLVLPDVEAPMGEIGRDRPEYRLFETGKASLLSRTSLSTSRLRPKLSLFAETAVGRPPGLNFFETDFKPFYSAGVRFTWSPWNWSKARRERSILGLEAELVDAEEELFSRQIRIAVQQDLSDIRKYQELLERDDQAVALRNRIAKNAGSQLENGVITATDYLIERNAASRASLTRSIHEIQLERAKVNYLTTIGR
ncbi:MAG: TolC family protein [Rhodothermia bacterium]|nr:TolC family protein [Rhodothermia bacterium]